MVIFETTKVFGAFLAQKFGRMDLFCYLCGVFIYYPTNSI